MDQQYRSVSEKDVSQEHRVSILSLIPRGYRFVPKGDPYVTRNCRSRTLEAGLQLYVVHEKGKRSSTLGLRVPVFIAKEVLEEATASKDIRARAVKRKDDREIEGVRTLMAKQWPDIPASSVDTVLRHAFAKKSGRVGRKGAMELSKRVELAVYAHARHTHTNYDHLLKTMPRDQARREIQKELNTITKQWAGSARVASNRVKSKRATKSQRKEKVLPREKGHQRRRSAKTQKSKTKRASKAS